MSPLAITIFSVGILLLIFQDKIAAVVVDLLSRKHETDDNFSKQLKEIEAMPPSAATEAALEIARSKAVPRNLPTVMLTFPNPELEFLNWFFERYDLLSLTGEDRTLDRYLLREIMVNGDKFLIVGEDEFGEKCYIVSLDSNAGSVYDIYKPDDGTERVQAEPGDDLEFIAESIPQFLLIVNCTQLENEAE